MTSDSMSEFVRAGYDAIAAAYLEARRNNRHDLEVLDEWCTALSPGARILDVGCGSGVPIAQHLVHQGFDVLGVDISEAQLNLARRLVPQGRFFSRDMTRLQPGEFSVEAIVAFYSLIHTPRTSHQRILSTLHSFLPTGGRILCTFGSTDWEGEEPFFGTPMRWSHFGPEESTRVVEQAGFQIEAADIVEHTFEGEAERHLVVRATA